jgi:hypothetical protein
MTAGAVTAAAHIRRLKFPLLCMLLMVLPVLEAPKFGSMLNLNG